MEHGLIFSISEVKIRKYVTRRHGRFSIAVRLLEGTSIWNDMRICLNKIGWYQHISEGKTTGQYQYTSKGVSLPSWEPRWAMLVSWRVSSLNIFLGGQFLLQSFFCSFSSEVNQNPRVFTKVATDEGWRISLLRFGENSPNMKVETFQSTDTAGKGKIILFL